MADSTETLRIVRTYHASWTSKEFARAISMLSPKLQVEVPVNRYPDKESFAAALSGFGSMVQEAHLLGEFGNGKQALLLYEMKVGGLGTLLVAEHFVVEGGLIVKIRQIHDTYAVRKAGFASAGAKAIPDTEDRSLLASVDLAASPERVFQALASAEIVNWWVRPGVFDTREWHADVRTGGHWRASGVARGRSYTLEGEFLAVDSPTRLVHTWQGAGVPGQPSVVTYILAPTQAGTRLTVRQTDLSSPEQCINTAIGWETSFDQLALNLQSEGMET